MSFLPSGSQDLPYFGIDLYRVTLGGLITVCCIPMCFQNFGYISSCLELLLMSCLAETRCLCLLLNINLSIDVLPLCEFVRSCFSRCLEFLAFDLDDFDVTSLP